MLNIFDIVQIKNALAADGKPDKPALFWRRNEDNSGELVVLGPLRALVRDATHVSTPCRPSPRSVSL